MRFITCLDSFHSLELSSLLDNEPLFELSSSLSEESLQDSSSHSSLELQDEQLIPTDLKSEVKVTTGRAFLSLFIILQAFVVGVSACFRGVVRVFFESGCGILFLLIDLL